MAVEERMQATRTSDKRREMIIYRKKYRASDQQEGTPKCHTRKFSQSGVNRDTPTSGEPAERQGGHATRERGKCRQGDSPAEDTRGEEPTVRPWDSQAVPDPEEHD